MTKQEADEILQYVAQKILSPMAFDKRPASEVLRMNLCSFSFLV